MLTAGGLAGRVSQAHHLYPVFPPTCFSIRASTKKHFIYAPRNHCLRTVTQHSSSLAPARSVRPRCACITRTYLPHIIRSRRGLVGWLRGWGRTWIAPSSCQLAPHPPLQSTPNDASPSPPPTTSTTTENSGSSDNNAGVARPHHLRTPPPPHSPPRPVPPPALTPL